MYECENFMQIPGTISVICYNLSGFAYDLLACWLFDCAVGMNTQKESTQEMCWTSQDSWQAHKYTCCIIYISIIVENSFQQRISPLVHKQWCQCYKLCTLKQCVCTGRVYVVPLSQMFHNLLLWPVDIIWHVKSFNRAADKMKWQKMKQLS
jgi:hypothetical protein